MSISWEIAAHSFNGMLSLYYVYFLFWLFPISVYEEGTVVLIVQVPCNCLPFTICFIPILTDILRPACI